MASTDPPRVPLFDRNGVMAKVWTDWFRNLPTTIIQTPTITSFQNAKHNHTNDVGGGKLDHGSALNGLTDDDHPQYVKADGTRDIDYAAGEFQIGDVSGGNYVQIEADGTLELVGSATVWDDANVGSVSLGMGATAPDRVAVNGTGIRGYGFDGAATTEMMEGSLEIEHGWKEGSDITFHLHWMPSTNDLGNVKWQLEYFLAKSGTQVTGSTTISVTEAAGGVAWMPIMSSFPAIVTAGYAIGTQLCFRLFRNPGDAADTYPADAVVHGTVGVHLECDTIGSRQISTK